MSSAAVAAGSARPRKKKPGPRSTTARTARFVLLVLFLLLVLLPAYVLFVTSFKPSAETSADRAWLLPQNWTTEGWRTAWDSLSPSLWRTFQLAVPAALISAFIGSVNGFVLSRWRFPGADVLFTLFLFGMFIPYQAVVIPLRQLTVWIGLPNGIPTLILVHIIYGIPICTLIFRNYYASVPHELVEAAQVDGAGMIRTYASIILPLSGPGFVVTIIWQFTSAWNDYLFAIFLSNTRNGPITIALNALAGGQLTNYSASMAGAMIASIPTLVVYVVLGRYFVGGLMAGSVKS
ncbi:carbohydrate ABC transporter permease [Motilibacter aurantiacus]|uniref:carbohydrate ABC transporter permease n=1 Tax=Motilibacter aurantiacus TaxID=2714955 RepID=UPI00140CFCB9|nr:carbohydrate ABC transporter permease [Motilibacter aurantiacus]NHC46140.1 carbohydrate ABC transporter permease [Motilibacter aurantiacus]